VRPAASRLPLAALVLTACGASLAGGLAPEDARGTAATFGRALSSSQADALRPILPAKGKVHLALARLGPEEGMFAPAQVVAVFRDFLAAGRVTSFDVVSVDGGERTGAQAVGRASIIDRDGRKATIGLRLGFQPEDGRWVLREVKETGE
jgi:hypothetical protein